MLEALNAFAAAHGLGVKGPASRDTFLLEGQSGGRKTTVAQGSLVHRSGGRFFHFRITFSPFVGDPMWMLTPQGATRWSGHAPSPCAPEDVPGHARFAAPLAAFAKEVNTHWQLKLGEQGLLYLEALELVSPKAWELGWDVLEQAWSR